MVNRHNRIVLYRNKVRQWMPLQCLANVCAARLFSNTPGRRTGRCIAIARVVDEQPLSPLTTWISVPRSAFAFTKGAPRYFHSSPGVRRGFCENCGSPITYENKRIEGEIHIHAVSLLDANYASPSCHVFVNEQLPWFEALDDLPRFATTGRDGASPIRIGAKRKKVD